MFLTKKHNFLEFSKTLYKTSNMKYFDYQIIFGVNATVNGNKRIKKTM